MRNGGFLLQGISLYSKAIIKESVSGAKLPFLNTFKAITQKALKGGNSSGYCRKCS